MRGSSLHPSRWWCRGAIAASTSKLGCVRTSYTHVINLGSDGFLRLLLATSFVYLRTEHPSRDATRGLIGPGGSLCVCVHYHYVIRLQRARIERRGAKCKWACAQVGRAAVRIPYAKITQFYQYVCAMQICCVQTHAMHARSGYALDRTFFIWHRVSLALSMRLGSAAAQIEMP